MASGDLRSRVLRTICPAMDMTVTLICLAAALGLAAVCGWRGAAAPDVVRARPRMAPWRFLMVLFAGAALLLLIHVGGLLGAVAAP